MDTDAPADTPAHTDPLAEPPPAPRGDRGLTALAWVVALLLCGLVFWDHNAPHGASTAPGPTPGAPPTAPVAGTGSAALPPPGMLDPLARLVMGAPSAERAQAAKMIGMFAGGPAGDLRLAMLRAEVSGPEDGLTALDAMSALAEGSDVAAEAALVRRLIESGADSLTPEEREGIATRHGYIGELALTRGQPDTDTDRAALLARAESTYVKVIVLEVVGLGGLVLAGLACVITAVIFIALGHVKPTLREPGVGGCPGAGLVAPWSGSIYIETFAVFMVAMVLMREVGPLLRGALGNGAILAQWLVAPVVFWPLLRRVPWREARVAMGWHTGRGVLREIGAGAIGYLACSPIVLAGIGMTLVLGLVRAMLVGPDAEPPTHPIGALLSGADAWMIAAIASLAVGWAPLVEESIFRGAFYAHLRSRMHWLFAGPIQGVLFAAVHPQGWVAIPALGSIGVAMGLLREWRSSLIPCVTAHALNNGTIVTILVIVMSL